MVALVAPVLRTGEPVTGEQLNGYLQAIAQAVSALQNPQTPAPLFATTKAMLPAAASFYNCAAFVTDLAVVAVSNGTNWINAGTGAVLA